MLRSSKIAKAIFIGTRPIRISKIVIFGSSEAILLMWFESFCASNFGSRFIEMPTFENSISALLAACEMSSMAKPETP